MLLGNGDNGDSDDNGDNGDNGDDEGNGIAAGAGSFSSAVVSDCSVVPLTWIYNKKD